jgi:hypothetical protein
VRKERNLLPEKQKKAYTDFYKSARQNETLEPKITLMLHMVLLAILEWSITLAWPKNKA